MHPTGSGTGSSPSRSVVPNTPSASRVAIIPARYGSTRFPGKALADLDGRPMIAHVYERAKASRAVDRVIVATDDPRIAEAVDRFGGSVALTRADHASGTDRVAEVAAALDCAIVVGVQGDEPLLDPRMIDEAVAPFDTDPAVVMSTLRRRIADLSDLDNPHVVKVVVDREGYALYFSRAALPYVRDEKRRRGSFYANGKGEPTAPAFYKHIGLYVYRRDFLLTFARLEPTALERAEALEQLRALEHGYRIRTVETAFDSIGVDTPEDLERVRALAAAGARL